MLETRQEHIEFCKTRAYEYLEMGELGEAIASLQSDLRKHSETASHGAIELSLRLQMAGQLNTKEDVRLFIDGIG